jgi:hypothetical protein
LGGSFRSASGYVRRAFSTQRYHPAPAIRNSEEKTVPGTMMEVMEMMMAAAGIMLRLSLNLPISKTGQRNQAQRAMRSVTAP